MTSRQEKAELRQFFNDIYGYNTRSIYEIKRILVDRFNVSSLTSYEGAYDWLRLEKKEYEKEQKRIAREERRLGSKSEYIARIIASLQRFQDTDDFRLVLPAWKLDQLDITNKDILRIINDNLPYTSGKKGVFMYLEDNKAGRQFYPLNARTRGLIEKMLVSGSVKIEEARDSDEETLNNKIETMSQADIILTNVKPKSNMTESGDYFKYKSKLTQINFKRYGILSIDDDVSDNMDILKHNCLYNAFKVAGMDKEKLEEFKTMLCGQYVPITKLKLICEKLDISISLKKLQQTKHHEATTHYGEADEHYDIGLIDEHYFIIEDMEYTKWAIENYFNITHMKKWNELRSMDKREKSRFTDSYTIIKTLYENRDTHLTPITNDEVAITDTPYDAIEGFSYGGLKHAVDTNNNKPFGVEDDEEDISAVVKEVKKELGRTRIKWNNAFLDFETRNDENNVICSFIGVVSYENSDKLTVTYNNADDMYSDKSVYDILEALKDNTKLIIQNAKFDFNFMIDKLHSVKIIENAGRIITASGMYKNKKIMVIDFINYTGMALRDCAESFKLDIHKEYIPYRLYDNVDVLADPYVNINETIKTMKMSESETKLFLANIDKWGLKKGDKFNALRYCVEYCIMDVKVLKQSYIKMRDMIKVELGVNIDADESNDYRNILTISSLAKKYGQDNGFFTECVANSGVIREFVQKSIVGGRCMVSENKKKRINNSNAIDANSLYPSAINKLGGFLKGKPKMWSREVDMSRCDGYNIQIKIKSHSINRKMPLFSVMRNGKRDFTNDMDGHVIYIGKIALEDLVKYHGVEYEILNGIYWDEGRTTVDIDKLYQKRLKYKKAGDVKETIVKLILNSIYGFTIMKEHRQEVIIKDNELDMMKYITKNYNWIVRSENIKNSDKWIIKKLASTSDHMNYNHIGCEVLDMSKRIMNEMVCEIEDLGYECYYSDTDSIFIPNDALTHLNKYLGVQLGQSKLDFGDDIYINDGFLLGKKSYYVEFNKADSKGKTEKYRMKGIPSSTIKFYAKHNDLTIKQIYEKLYNGESITFDLCETEDNAPTKFKVDNKTNRQLERKTAFTRKVSFK